MMYPHNTTIKIVKQNDYNDVKPTGRYVLRTTYYRDNVLVQEPQ